MSPWLLYGVLTAAYVVMIALLLRRRRALRAEVAASERWPSAASRVVHSELQEFTSAKGGTTYFPRVVYDYDVGDRTLRGQRTTFGTPVGYNFRRNAERRLRALVDAA